ncbi:MAG TPA: hypothetical protein PKN33_10165 [Phycisphaerae bacterium]|nr:hypothetical protein [Phycisphaerae bacterium]
MDWIRHVFYRVFSILIITISAMSATQLGFWLLGRWGAFCGAFFGMLFGGILSALANTWLFCPSMKKFKSMKEEELWSMVKAADWTFEHTLAFRNLAARGEDVSGELPRIVSMLNSDDMRKRVLGWVAFRDVFKEELKLAEGYSPYRSSFTCRAKIKLLTRVIGEKEVEAAGKVGSD